MWKAIFEFSFIAQGAITIDNFSIAILLSILVVAFIRKPIGKLHYSSSFL